MASQFEFFDGFGSGNLDLWDVNVNGTLATGIPGMDNYCLNCASNNPYVIKNLTHRDYYYFAFLFRPYGGYTDMICQFYNSSTLLGEVRSDRSGNFFPRLYWGTTLIATGSLPVQVDTTSLIEVYYLPHLTTGNFQIKVNGIADPSLTLSGIKTAPSTLQINKMVFGVSNTITGYYGRVIVASDSWVGNLRIQTLTPSAAGNYSEWTPSTGSNYQTVDEIPYSDTDYNLTNEVDKKDSFTYTDLSGTVASVKSVMIQTRVVAVGIPTPTTIRQLIRTNNSDYVGDSKTVPIVNKTVYNKWDQNPNTSSNWTTSDINNAEYGYQSST